MLAVATLVVVCAFALSGCTLGGVFAADNAPSPRPGDWRPSTGYPPEPPPPKETTVVTNTLLPKGESAGSHRPHKAHKHRPPSYYEAAPPRPTPDAPRGKEVASNAFRNLPIIYRKPARLDYGKASLFTLVVAAHDLEAARARVAYDTAGTEVQAQVALSNKVRASLWSPNKDVEIVAKTDLTRDVSDVANTTWTWTVTPHTDEPVMIELDLYNLTSQGGKDLTLDSTAYHDQFVVQISWFDHAWRQIERIDPVWKWLTAFFSAIAAAILTWRKVFGKEEKKL
jgi:hypothetical protein